MALIKCSECGKEISDKAPNCPNCGNPINHPSSTAVHMEPAPPKRRKYRVRLIIFTPMFFIGFFMAVIWGLSGNNSSITGFWSFIAVVGFIGMVVSAIGSWLAAP